MQAKDIPDQAFLDAVERASRSPWPHLPCEPLAAGVVRWANRHEVVECLGVPEKVALAKARKLIRRGLVKGCACGCRGDFEIPS